MIIVVIVLMAWAAELVFGVIWKKQNDDFAKFLNERGQDILSGQTVEYKGETYTADTVLVQCCFCCSVLVITFMRPSAICTEERSAIIRAICIIMTVLGGWWGIPWGPVRSVQSIVKTISPAKFTVSELLSEQ